MPDGREHQRQARKQRRARRGLPLRVRLSAPGAACSMQRAALPFLTCSVVHGSFGMRPAKYEDPGSKSNVSGLRCMLSCSGMYPLCATLGLLHMDVLCCTLSLTQKFITCPNVCLARDVEAPHDLPLTCRVKIASLTPVAVHKVLSMC